MPLFESFGISSSGLSANRLWLDIISNNIANMNSAGRPNDPNLKPYSRQLPVFSEELKKAFDIYQGNGYSGAGVKVARITQESPQSARLVHDPSHPYADPVTGYVAYPNINVANEMVNMISATRAYEANVTALNAAKDMALRALEIGRG